MKKYIYILLVALTFVAFATTLQAEEETKTKYTEAIIKTTSQCGMCKERIEKAVNKLDGIQKADLDVETKELYVKYDPEEVDLDDIKKAVSKAGYDADEVKAKKKAYKKLPKCCKIGGGH
jgi:periplasmic mercuric ion binding protein